MSCKVFRTMFTSGLVESRDNAGLLLLTTSTDVCPSSFEIFLRYAYIQDLPLSIIRQSVAPWAGSFQKTAYASIISLILGKLVPNLIYSEDPPDYTRTKVPEEFLVKEFPGQSIPFPGDLIEDTIKLLLELLQLADEFGCQSLENLVELLICCLIGPETLLEIEQFAVLLSVRAHIIVYVHSKCRRIKYPISLNGYGDETRK